MRNHLLEQNQLLLNVLSAFAFVFIFASGFVATASAQNTEGIVDLKQFVGDYEGREITLSNGTLYYQRDPMPKAVQLSMVSKDVFEIVVPAGAVVQHSGANSATPQFKFNRNESNVVVSLTLVDSDGKELAHFSKKMGSVVN